MSIKDLFTQPAPPAPVPDQQTDIGNLFGATDLRPRRDCHVGQHKVFPSAGGLIICPADYGQKCLDPQGHKCIGCAWACTDCILLLKKAQATPRNQRPWSLKSELRDDALREAAALDADIPGPHRTMEEYDQMLFEGLFVRYGRRWVNQQMARLIKLNPSYAKD